MIIFIKKICLLFLLLPIFTCSAQKIKVKGVITNLKDANLYLWVFENGNYICKKDIKVSDGKFSFLYKYGDAELGCITTCKEFKMPTYIFFERDELNIQAVIFPKFNIFRINSLRGNGLNKKYYDYEKKRINYVVENKRERGIKVSGIKITNNFIKDNITNILGLFEIYKLSKNPRLFRKNIYLFDNIPDELKKYDLYKEFQTNYNKLKTTSKGQKALDFNITTLKGEKLSLKSFKGKLLMIDFWASWCGPCCRELPELKEIYEKYHERGFEILGISLDGNKDSWLKAVKKFDLNWHNYSDFKEWKSELVSKYMVNGIPYNIIIDKKGNIVGKGLHGEKLETLIINQLK